MAKTTTKAPKVAKQRGTSAAKAPAATKPAKGAKTTEPKGPGVIASMIEYLQAATAAKPITKKVLLAKLAARFPDREETALYRTINCQLPSRLVKEKKLAIKKNENGYFVAK